MATKYEMHVYTMGTRAYAEEVCKAIDPDGPQNPEEKFLASSGPSVSPEAPVLMVASMSTQPEIPVLTASQQFLEAQTKLPSSSFSIKKGGGD